MYEAANIKNSLTVDEKGLKVKLRLLDGHFYDDVYFKDSLGELIDIIEDGEMLFIEKANGDKIFVNTRLVVDFVLS